MLDNRYSFESSPDMLTFEFNSTGPKGTITKVVHYTEINVRGYYNLGFGDKDPKTGFISDLTVTNNSDSKKVLATVAQTLYFFTECYPGAVVIATGSTLARTRLYRIGVANNLTDIEKDFIILGLTDEDWEPFRKNTTYHSFAVRKKYVDL
ncbi:DUF6934 family protein [Foetidibacter luteolus]|uniref:DUF6934 family protein n=1 Tax=Foetidibacter luteolus TaxID=2608880 RepID=UPI001A99D9FA|nr:hypothetical protein [Foetidibacter luteolus]